MRSTKEVGHIKNIVNFERLLMVIELNKEIYFPLDASLQVQKLRQTLLSAEHEMRNYNRVQAVYHKKVAERAIEFKQIMTLLTLVYNTVKLCNLSPEATTNIRHHIYKLQGKRLGENLSKEEQEILKASGKKRRSVSQVGYDFKISHLNKLLSALEIISNYQPYEAHLQTEQLNERINVLIQRSQEVTNLEIDLQRALAQRNEVLYAPQTGLCDIAKRVKTYFRALFGVKSTAFNEVRHIKFTRCAKFKQNETAKANTAFEVKTENTSEVALESNE